MKRNCTQRKDPSLKQKVINGEDHISVCVRTQPKQRKLDGCSAVIKMLGDVVHEPLHADIGVLPFVVTALTPLSLIYQACTYAGSFKQTSYSYHKNKNGCVRAHLSRVTPGFLTNVCGFKSPASQVMNQVKTKRCQLIHNLRRQTRLHQYCAFSSTASFCLGL